MATAAAHPNVVFILADQHRWDFTGYEHSNGLTLTPHLDALAGAGTILRSAYCTAPLCSPSRAALATGRYGMNSGCFTNLHEPPPGTPSFVQQFRAAGYRTSAIGKTHMAIQAYDADFCSPAHRAFMESLGWDECCEVTGNGLFKTGIQCAYTHFLKEHGQFEAALRFHQQWGYFMNAERKGDSTYLPHEWPLADEFNETNFIGARAVEWLRAKGRAQPFLLHVGFTGPHAPIEPLTKYMDPYREKPETAPWGARQAPEYLPQARRGYRAMITQIDDWIGAIRACLREQGLLDNTIVVYTADHGEMLGDHDLFDKTRFFEGSMRVPMVFSGPGVQSGRDSQALVELLDAGKTLCELCAVPPHALDQGRSLKPVLCGERNSHRETLYAEMGCDKMLFDGRYKLMWGDPGSDARQLGRLHLNKPVNIPGSPCRLYDLKEDPHELNDLAGQAGQESSRTILMAMMSKLLARINENTQAQPNKDRGQYRPL